MRENKKLIKIYIVIFIFIFCSTIGIIYYKIYNNPLISFRVIGDVHTNTKKLDNILKKKENIDALILNGDIVNEGKKEQYNEIINTINKNKDNLPQNIIYNIGNHEFYDKNNYPNAKEDSNNMIKMFQNTFGYEKPYHSQWINGYNFISLGSEETNTGMLSEVTAYISNEQKEWLKEKLKEDYKKNRPIFVFIHQSIYGNKFQIVEERGESLKDILKKYPEVIIINSHTHEDIERNNVFEYDKLKVIQTGAVYYTFINNEQKERNKDYSKSFGVDIIVYKGKIQITGKEFESNKIIYKKELSLKEHFK
ncbi:MAG: metallophosphoesterase family protein [Clostridium sp.]